MKNKMFDSSAYLGHDQRSPGINGCCMSLGLKVALI